MTTGYFLGDDFFETKAQLLEELQRDLDSGILKPQDCPVLVDVAEKIRLRSPKVDLIAKAGWHGFIDEHEGYDPEFSLTSDSICEWMASDAGVAEEFEEEGWSVFNGCDALDQALERFENRNRWYWQLRDRFRFLPALAFDSLNLSLALQNFEEANTNHRVLFCPSQRTISLTLMDIRNQVYSYDDGANLVLVHDSDYDDDAEQRFAFFEHIFDVVNWATKLICCKQFPKPFWFEDEKLIIVTDGVIFLQFHCPYKLHDPSVYATEGLTIGTVNGIVKMIDSTNNLFQWKIPKIDFCVHWLTPEYCADDDFYRFSESWGKWAFQDRYLWILSHLTKQLNASWFYEIRKDKALISVQFQGGKACLIAGFKRFMEGRK